MKRDSDTLMGLAEAMATIIAARAALRPEGQYNDAPMQRYFLATACRLPVSLDTARWVFRGQ